MMYEKAVQGRRSPRRIVANAMRHQRKSLAEIGRRIEAARRLPQPERRREFRRLKLELAEAEQSAGALSSIRAKMAAEPL